ALTKTYAYDFMTGNMTVEVDEKGHRTTYHYDVLNRVKQVVQADGSTKVYTYEESPYVPMQITYQDPEEVQFRYAYNIFGQLLVSEVWKNGVWVALNQFEYDAAGNKVKEIDANGHSIRYGYD